MQRARREAASFFETCSAPKKRCDEAHDKFSNSFVLSLSGSTYFMGDIIGSLDLDFDRVPGIKKDQTEACAWRFLRWRLADAKFADIYEGDWVKSCVGTVTVTREAQEARVNAIVAEMKAAPILLNGDLIALRDRYEPLEPLAVELIARTALGRTR